MIILIVLERVQIYADLPKKMFELYNWNILINTLFFIIERVGKSEGYLNFVKSSFWFHVNSST